MSWDSSWLDAAPRSAAAAISLAALALFLRHGNPDPSRSQTAAVEVALPAAKAERTKLTPVYWDIRTGGWRIRLDEVALSLPTAEEVLALGPEVSYQLRLSAFDELIVRHAEAAGFDWRLIAALIFEESGFNPNSISSKGAFGLMQVRDIAARDIGEDRYWLPEDNVRAGVRYLSRLREMFAEAGASDTLRLAIAAYNVGPAHLRDAQQVARRFGWNPWRWHGGLREALPLLEQEPVYRRLEHGYARGSVTAAYVDRVWQRFLEYQRATALFEASAHAN